MPHRRCMHISAILLRLLLVSSPVSAQLDPPRERLIQDNSPIVENQNQGPNLRRRLYSDIQERIIDGETTESDRYPYYVALYRKSGSFVCGGSLVAPDMVLTAAHCNTGDLKMAVIGRHARWSSSLDDVENREIVQVIPHPDFSYRTKSADQMILQLKKPSTFPYLKYINQDPAVPDREGTGITIIGLGVSDFKNSGSPEFLQEFTSSYVPNDECKAISTDEYSYENDIHEDHICVAGDGGQCFGDSGGPQLLLGKSPDEDVQVGIISWGFDCGTDDFPSVGSRTSWSTFIQDTVCGSSSDPPPILCDLVVDIPDADIASLNVTDTFSEVMGEEEDLEVVFASFNATDDDP